MSNSRLSKTHNSTAEDEECWKKVIEFYQREFLCDIRLKVEWESKMVHGFVLSLLCPTGPWAKMRTTIKSSDVVELDVSATFKQPGILTTIIDYIYLGVIEINQSNIFSVLDVAKELNLTELLNHCSQFLLEYLDVKNVLTIFNQAYESNLHDLSEVCLVFCREVFHDLLECNCIEHLSESFIEMFMSQRLIISSVEPSKLVFFVLRWLIGNSKNVHLLGDFLKNVDINQFQEACCMINQIANVTDSVKAQLREGEKLYIKPTPASVIPIVKDNTALGGRYIIVRDCKAATVYDTVSGKWLSMPRVSYKHILTLSQKKLICSDERLYTRTLDVIDINTVQKVKTIFIGDCARYLGPIFYKRDLYILVESRRRGAYEFTLYKKCDDTDGHIFIRCFQYCTHIYTQRIIKDFCYYNDDDCTILVIITCPDNVTHPRYQSLNFFHVFRLKWQPYSINTLIKSSWHLLCDSLSDKNFIYSQRKLYVFDNEIENTVFNAIKFNFSPLIPVRIYDLSGDCKHSITHYLAFPKLGLNYLPLRPKRSSHNLINNSSGVNENVVPRCDIQPVEGKLFVVAHRAPAIVQCFVVDLLTESWQITTPIPLNGMFKLEVSTFYCEESIDEVLPEREKVFDTTEVMIFKDWHLQTLSAL